VRCIFPSIEGSHINIWALLGQGRTTNIGDAKLHLQITFVDDMFIRALDGVHRGCPNFWNASVLLLTFKKCLLFCTLHQFMDDLRAAVRGCYFDGLQVVIHMDRDRQRRALFAWFRPPFSSTNHSSRIIK